MNANVVREIFMELVGQVPPEHWQARLVELAGDNGELRRRVERLLAAHRQADSFLEAPAGGPAISVEPPGTEEPGTVIGPYKLLEQIGEGGFGIVFLAEQQQPLRRKVALKVLKPGMDSRQVIARFEAERQALALMDHPNIAKVLDGGETATARPYFVMDLVKGIPITAYCDESQLTTRERLELFVPVCEAVQHAHQKGIIHRDIKPSNVLISRHDATPVVKVIDFGIAKALGQQLTDKTLFTNLAQLLGTPLYMSPEQAGLSDLDVDTRSDIYSLGVLLYELLTGTTPFDKDRFKEAGYDEMRRIIREEEPLKPSTRLSTLGQAVTTVSANRKSDPRKLSQLFRADLDWVVMKCLEKDRTRRYETANGLARDIQRYLNDEPVQACPPSPWYRLRKFARRQRPLVAGGGALLLVIALLGGGNLWWIAGQRTEAERAVAGYLQKAELLQEQGRWDEAAQVLARAEERLAGGGPAGLLDKVRHLRDDADWVAELEEARLCAAEAGPDPQSSFNFPGADRAYQEAFARRGLDLDDLGTEEAAVRIRASTVRARLVEALDFWASTKEKLRAGSGEQLRAVANRADDDSWRRRLRQLRARNDRAALERLAGEDDALAQPAMNQVLLGAALERTARERLLRRVQQTHPADFWINFDLANLVRGVGPSVRAEEVIGFYRVALALRPQSHMVHNNLGIALLNQRKLAEAEAALRKAIAIKPDYPMTHCNLGFALLNQEKLPAAEAALRKSIALNPDLVEAHSNLGAVLAKQGKLAEAEAACRKAIALDPNCASAHGNLGCVLLEQGKLAEAEAACRKAIALNPDLPEPYGELAAVLTDQGKLAEAEAAGRKAIALKPDYPEAHVNLGDALADQGKLAEAVAVYHKAIALKPDNPNAHNNLGKALWDQGKLAEAAASCREAIRLKPDSPRAHTNLGCVLRAQGKLAEAVEAHRKGIALKPDCAEAHCNLGAALESQGKPAEAEAAYRKAVALRRDYPEAHYNLGRALRDQGRFVEALAALKRGHELGSRNPRWTYPSAQLVQQCGRLVELDRKLPAILSGQEQPADAVECIALAELCQLPCKKRYAAAARFYGEAFAAEAERAGDQPSEPRYNAACVAALAGCGQGEDGANLDDTERIRFRRQAYDWLGAELAAWRQLLEKEPEKIPVFAQTMQHWQQDKDFAGVRGAEAFAKLPEAERQEWQKLWAEIDGLRQRALDLAKKSANADRPGN
jgi:serine/threonine protein kinase/tetratricopeptide (TPR) repeat protein